MDEADINVSGELTEVRSLNLQGFSNPLKMYFLIFSDVLLMLINNLILFVLVDKCCWIYIFLYGTDGLLHTDVLTHNSHYTWYLLCHCCKIFWINFHSKQSKSIIYDVLSMTSK